MTSSGPAPTPRPGRTAGRTARAIWRRLGLLGAESATPPRPLTFRAAVVIFVLAIVLAYLFVGPWFTIVTAALAIVTVRFNPDPGRPFAFATLALIVGAAFVSSVLVAPTEADPSILYAQARRYAAQFGSFAGVFFAIATMMYAVTERPPTVQAPATAPPGVLLRRWRVAARTDISVGLARLGAIGLAVGVGAVVRFAAAPGALPGETVPLIQNLRLGTTYSLDAGGGAVPTALWPPFGVGLAAYLPLSAKLVSLVVSLLVIAMAALAAWRLSGQRAAVVAAWLVAVVPACWALSLNELLAALFVLVAVAIVGRGLPGWGGLLAVGVCLGLAGLGRPDALFGLVVLGAVVAVRARRADRDVIRPVAMVLLGALLTVAGWVNYTATTFGFPYVAETVRAALRDPIGAGGAGIRLAGAAVLLALLAWGVIAADRSARRSTVWALVLAAWCLLTAVGSGQIGDPLSWSAPAVAVAVGVLRPWEATGRSLRSARPGRTSSSASDLASTDVASR